MGPGVGVGSTVGTGVDVGVGVGTGVDVGVGITGVGGLVVGVAVAMGRVGVASPEPESEQADISKVSASIKSRDTIQTLFRLMASKLVN